MSSKCRPGFRIDAAATTRPALARLRQVRLDGLIRTPEAVASIAAAMQPMRGLSLKLLRRGRCAGMNSPFCAPEQFGGQRCRELPSWVSALEQTIQRTF
jgi:hypothetical protein